MMTATFAKLNGTMLSDRIDATYYRPEYLANEMRLRRSGLDVVPLSSLVTSGRRAVYFDTSTLEETAAPSHWVPFLTADDFGTDGFVLNLDARRRVSPEFASRYPNGLLRANELLVKVKGPNQITSYNEREPARPVLVSGTIWGALVRRECVDPHYLVTALSSVYAETARTRLRTNLNVEFLSPTDLMLLDLPLPRSKDAQKYIGDKVRQAEWLRNHARHIQKRIDAIVSSGSVREAFEAPDRMTNRLHGSAVNNRLDAKYYGPRALRVFQACLDDGGVAIGKLDPNITNGFEYRRFVPTGRAYVTVSEVSTGRVDLTHAPRIPIEIEIPTKGHLNPCCVLVVRGGSVGFAAKAHPEDCNAIVSSDLIRLEFSKEETAAAVGLFLNSSAGQCLQHKAAYGGVMPKLGQDELLAIPVPQSVLEHGGSLLQLFNAREIAFRCSQRLTTAAKLLVEALIEGKITEDDLTGSLAAIGHQDTSLDRTILSRLTEDGIDVAGRPPLFPDLVSLYTTIDGSAHSIANNEGTL